MGVGKAEDHGADCSAELTAGSEWLATEDVVGVVAALVEAVTVTSVVADTVAPSLPPLMLMTDTVLDTDSVMVAVPSVYVTVWVAGASVLTTVLVTTPLGLLAPLPPFGSSSPGSRGTTEYFGLDAASTSSARARTSRRGRAATREEKAVSAATRGMDPRIANKAPSCPWRNGVGATVARASTLAEMSWRRVSDGRNRGVRLRIRFRVFWKTG